MAVINEVVLPLKHPQNAAVVTGARVLNVTRVITIAAGDDDGSKFLIAELPDTAIIDDISLEAVAITAGTSYDVGICNVDGSVVLASVFAATLDMSNVTGLPVGPLGDPIRKAMPARALTDANKALFEHAGHVSKAQPGVGETQRKTKYRITLTANTIGSANATIVARVQYRMAG